MKSIFTANHILHLLRPLLTAYLLWGLASPGYAQQGSQGNTNVFNGAEMTLFGAHNFLTGGSGTQPGVIGTIRTATYGILNFGTGATYTGATSANYVDGYVRKLGSSAFIFPVGDNSRMIPFAASADGTTGAYYNADPSVAVTSNLSGGNYPPLPAGAPFPTSSMGSGVLAVSNVEYWDIDGTNATPITLTWDGGSNVTAITASSLPSLTILGWNGTAWVVIASAVDVVSILGGASTLTAGSITTTSSIVPNTYTAYTLGAHGAALAVTWLDVQAIATDNRMITIFWSTATETNNAGFEVERSTDGQHFTSIGYKNGAGNATLVSNYSIQDGNVSAGVKYYYRIRQTDKNGRQLLSRMVTASLKNTGLVAKALPNPARHTLQLAVTSPKQQLVTIVVVDRSGRLLRQQTVSLRTGINIVTQDISMYSNGVYFARIQETDGNIYGLQFLIQQ